MIVDDEVNHWVGVFEGRLRNYKEKDEPRMAPYEEMLFRMIFGGGNKNDEREVHGLAWRKARGIFLDRHPDLISARPGYFDKGTGGGIRIIRSTKTW
jgi:hypothetical protein